MLQRPSRREVKAANQRSYAKRLRQGVGLYCVPLTDRDLDALIALGYLREGAEIDRAKVGEAVAAVVRSLRH
jgi:hypothetical protein